MFVFDNRDNFQGDCATTKCLMRPKGPAKASWFSLGSKSWVCTTCAQELNRDRVALSRKTKTNFVPSCISADEVTFKRLTGEMA